MTEYCLEAVLLCLHVPEVRLDATTLLLGMAFESTDFTQQLTQSSLMFNVFQTSIDPCDSDLIVVLQKVTAKEPALVQSMLSATLVEQLNQMMSKQDTDQFLRSNVKSVLKLIAEAD